MQLYIENTIVLTVSYCFYGTFSWYVFMSIKSDFGSEKEIQYFKAQIVSYLIYLAATWLWTLNELKVINIDAPMLLTLAVVCHISVSCTMYLWIKYYVYHLQIDFIEKKWFRRLFSIPIYFAVILIVSAYKYDFVFHVIQKGKRAEIIYDKYYYLLYVFFGMYFVFVVIETIITATKLKERDRRQEIILFIGYMFILTPIVVFSHFLRVLTVTTVSHLAAIFFTYISIQETRVRMDGLTRLNNRRVAEEYLHKTISELVEGKEEVAVFMIDVNRFKLVNDRYGHLEGDRALVIVGNVIKKVASSNNCFVGRYGGDEFIMIFHNRLPRLNNISKRRNTNQRSIAIEEYFENNIYNTLCKRLNKELEEECKNLNLEYELSLSVGYSVCKNSKDDPKVIIKFADEHLYQEKESYHKKNDMYKES
ncbi:GGDEF domain-containing protein [Lachnobacterium bovis]|uniref:GGDEF domain-containing protein n=1 Tax=Lachnobacterium bovis TaxID=140626 RepID=UPI00068E9A3A|nr:GGDEF domain-containing protein [Lachnobacterium bovis]